MESLLVLLDKIQQVSPLPILSQEIIIVHNAGMQHWLNLSLAKQRGISMNFRYALPSQYLWQLVRSLANADKVPEQSPYSREVLTWRLDKLLTSEDILADDDFKTVNDYWQNESSSSQAQLKRFQLAMQLADLFEQYLIFRPQWLDDWQQDKLSAELLLNDNICHLAKWQKKIWQKLIAQSAYNPKAMITSAIENISQNKALLPARLSFFGINSLAPIWLEFISALSEHIEIHFFHLNPCYDYWGDILTEKQAINSLTQWTNEALSAETTDQQLSELIGNPLLANLGQQGREFLALLQQYSTINIEAFERVGDILPVEVDKTLINTKATLLQQIQQDILTLRDARISPCQLIDNSIVITSCHSALREIQGLHDWLLHQFNQDASLTPKDILVMCPQVEHYAPYIDAVFSRSWQDMGDDVPPLPCSIADRVSKDSEPLVAAFLSLLQLPDSRFQVSKIIELLRLPALQEKFSLTLADIDKISQWLEQAAIHWGLDGEHKQTILKLSTENDFFTWEYGLSRLLLGFAFGDEQTIFQEKLLLPAVEGNDALLLGKLSHLIEQLQYFAKQMTKEKTAAQWLTFLHELLNDLFISEEDIAFDIIQQALANLVDYCDEAHYNETISLIIIREFLQNHFSQPDPGRQFLVGQVTFCSMLPMRSIPFKVIAILGLNDGEFPRQRQPLGFDLMASTPPQVGDRSRRGDDRYLFLEAIICARKALYLSYQGRNIRNNNEQQPSIVLKELMEYLDLGYGWSLLEQKKSAQSLSTQGCIRQLPMQPFSDRNYLGNYVSFDRNWLTLRFEKITQERADNALIIPSKPENTQQLDLEEMIRFFSHPAKYFAKRQLNLHFESDERDLTDSEPFSSSHLAVYQLKQVLLATSLQPFASLEDQERAIEEQINAAKLSGQFPDLPTMQVEYKRWQQETQMLADKIKNNIGNVDVEYNHYDIELTLAGQKIILNAKLALSGNTCVNYRSSSAKAKDFITLYLQRLFILVWQQQASAIKGSLDEQQKALALNNVHKSMGWYFNSKAQKINQYSFEELDFSSVTTMAKPPNNALAMLELFITYFLKGQCQPLLLNAHLGKLCCKLEAKGRSKEKAVKINTQQAFEFFWHDENEFNAYDRDPYIQFFWPTCPELSSIQADLNSLYEPLYQQLKGESDE